MTISPNKGTEKTAPGLALISSLEQHKYLFETLWNKAIPADQKIKEIEGVIPSFIDTIAGTVRNSKDYFRSYPNG